MSEASDIISFLRSKGIKSINIRYRGLFEGGLVQNGFSRVRLFSPVGTGRELEDFTELVRSQNVSVFAEAGLFTAASEKNGAVSTERKKESCF